MEHILEILQNHFPFILEHKYIFLLIASSIEGFNTMILTGFLISVGAFKLLPAALICLAGETISSYFWYGVGRMGGASSIDWLTRNSPRKRRFVERFRSYIEQYTSQILLLVKLTFSLTIITLVLVGSTKYNIRKFSLYNFVGSIGWVIITFSIGYFFGQGYKLYLGYFENISYLIVFLVIAGIIIYTTQHISSAIFTRTIFINDRLQTLNEKIKEGVNKIMDDKNERT